MHGSVGHSIFTKSVVDLVNIIHSKSPQKDSLFEQAEQFYLNHKEDKAQLRNLKVVFDKAESKFNNATKKTSLALRQKFNDAKQALKEEKKPPTRVKTKAPRACA